MKRLCRKVTCPSCRGRLLCSCRREFWASRAGTQGWPLRELLGRFAQSWVLGVPEPVAAAPLIGEGERGCCGSADE